MRLTTYNIRSKYLLAGCCLSEYMERYWTYLEEGELKKADCARKKALKLDALRNTLLRFSPSIANAKRKVVTATVTAGTISFPHSVEGITVNGINIMDPIYFHTGTNLSVFEGVANNINNRISNEDDRVQATIDVSQSPLKATFTFTYEEDMSPPVFGVSSFGVGLTATYAFGSEEDYVFGSCLTDAQILKVVGKIDELCECEC